ncbi:hypothetical protein DSB72_11050, partial [Salmonella enterica subsp. enterica serovar Typhimurium]
ILKRIIRRSNKITPIATMTNGMIYLAFTLLWVTSLFRRQIPVVPDGNRVAIAPILITVETNERSQMLYGC